MSDGKAVMQTIHDAFGENIYPGDNYIQGSFEGCEPSDEVGPFQGQADWTKIEADFLDAHAGALNFFSEAGFRFFIPAFLIADVEGRLKVADPLFFLTHGFSEVSVEAPVGNRIFTLRTGRSQFINPRRYGATTFYDYARYRLSVFTREEAKAIVAYLRYRQEADPAAPERMAIESALDGYWLERTKAAPPAQSLTQYLTQQAEYLAAIMDGKKNP